MKILCMIDSLGPGGAQRQLVGLAVMLKQSGFDVKVVTWIRKDNDFFYPHISENGVGFEFMGSLRKSSLRLWNINKLIKREKPDVVISYYKYMSVFLCAHRQLNRSYKLIISERSTTQKLTLYERIRLYLLRFSDAIVPNSEAQAAFIRSHYPSLKAKITVITNFTDTGLFKRSDCKPLESGTSCLVVGRFTPPKNTLTFLKAIRQVVEKGVKISVKWYGNITNAEYYGECEKLRAELGLEDIVTFHNPTPDIVKVYEDASFFCLPSLYEGYPNVICEAMACGLPVVCSNACDNPYIVKDGVNGLLFDPLSADDMAEKLIRYISLPFERKQLMGKESRALAEEKFSSRKLIEKYIRLIESITA